MFIRFLMCRLFRIENTISSDWNSLFTFTQKRRRACMWAHPTLIVINNKSNHIKITIWVILDNIVVHLTYKQLSVVCVISIISYRHITIFKSILRGWYPIIANLNYVWPNVNYIQDKWLHICRKHFVTIFLGVLFWLPLFNLCPWAFYPMILLVIFPNIPNNLPDLHWPVALSIQLKFITNLILNITCFSMPLLSIKAFRVTIVVRLEQDTNW